MADRKAPVLHGSSGEGRRLLNALGLHDEKVAALNITLEQGTCMSVEWTTTDNVRTVYFVTTTLEFQRQLLAQLGFTDNERVVRIAVHIHAQEVATVEITKFADLRLLDVDWGSVSRESARAKVV